MAKHTQYYELREALKAPGCPICRLVVKAVDRYAASIVYEYANDPGVQEDALRARGWCNLHAWQLADQTGAAFDVAILYRTTLKTLLQAVNSAQEQAIKEDKDGPAAWLRSAVGSAERGQTTALATALSPRGHVRPVSCERRLRKPIWRRCCSTSATRRSASHSGSTKGCVGPISDWHSSRSPRPSNYRRWSSYSERRLSTS